MVLQLGPAFVLTSDVPDPADVILQRISLDLRLHDPCDLGAAGRGTLDRRPPLMGSKTRSSVGPTLRGESNGLQEEAFRTHCPFDADGTGRPRRRPGRLFKLYFLSNLWREMRKLKIKSTEPVLVTLHRSERASSDCRPAHAPRCPVSSLAVNDSPPGRSRTLGDSASCAENLPGRPIRRFGGNQMRRAYAWDPAQSSMSRGNGSSKTISLARLELAFDSDRRLQRAGCQQ